MLTSAGDDGDGANCGGVGGVTFVGGVDCRALLAAAAYPSFCCRWIGPTVISYQIRTDRAAFDATVRRLR